MSESLVYEDFSFTMEPSERRVYSVSEITREIKRILGDRFPTVCVEGEISNVKKHTSGHLYFSLKDAHTQISCVMWRTRNQNLLFNLEDGMKIQVLGNVSVYERQGRYQLDILQLRPEGIGDLQLAFEALKKRLHEEGLFDIESKKSLPDFPKTVGVVTSPTGAAIRDIQSVIYRRFPSVQIILRPVRVQGKGAADEIAEAIQEFNDYGNVDVLIIGRGGGAVEDLWAFNEEIIARAIYKSNIPIVSAVGHEIDFSISDFVSDLRMPTPSAAAERVVPDRSELLQAVQHQKEKIARSLEMRVLYFKERLDSMIRSYGFRWPEDRIREYKLHLDEIVRALETGLFHTIKGMKSQLEHFRASLLALNPEAVLRRGYSITTRVLDNHLVKKSEELEKEEIVRIRFAVGSVKGKIEEIYSE
jgi:exodeoxyribonuclease VII large subunit